jgi:hypothetical protein
MSIENVISMAHTHEPAKRHRPSATRDQIARLYTNGYFQVLTDKGMSVTAILRDHLNTPEVLAELGRDKPFSPGAYYAALADLGLYTPRPRNRVAHPEVPAVPEGQ